MVRTYAGYHRGPPFDSDRLAATRSGASSYTTRSAPLRVAAKRCNHITISLRGFANLQESCCLLGIEGEYCIKDQRSRLSRVRNMALLSRRTTPRGIRRLRPGGRTVPGPAAQCPAKRI